MSAATLRVTTDSPAQTQAFGRRIGVALAGGEVIALIGPLGAGKTQLVKGIAAGNGPIDPDSVTSPTFVLVNEYPGGRRLYHIDTYRLQGGAELEALGIDEMVSPEASVVIEWADRVEAALPADRLTVGIEPTGDTLRTLTLSASGLTSQRLLNKLTAGECDEPRRGGGQ